MYVGEYLLGWCACSWAGCLHGMTRHQHRIFRSRRHAGAGQLNHASAWHAESLQNLPENDVSSIGMPHADAGLVLSSNCAVACRSACS
jgi:hypothetical protein